MRLMLIGPYWADTLAEIKANVRVFEVLAGALWDAGHQVFAPAMNSLRFTAIPPKELEPAYKDFALWLLRSAPWDAIVTLPHWPDSPGAVEEVYEARRLGIRVYLHLEDVPDA